MFLVHILLLLLKIIGILLLVLLCLVLLVLLVPVRYSFSLKKDEKLLPDLQFGVTWLFHLLHFKADYINRVFAYELRILGIPFMGNQAVFLKKQAARQKRKQEKEQKKARKKAEKAKQGGKKELTITSKDGEEPKTEPLQAEKAETGSASKAEPLQAEKTQTGGASKAEPLQTEKTQTGGASTSAALQTEKTQTDKEESAAVKTGEKEMKKPQTQADTSPKENASLFTRIKGSLAKLSPITRVKSLFARFSSLAEKLKSHLADFSEKKEKLSELPWREWLDFGRDILARLLRHILPRRLTGTITFGFGNPALTGQVTGAAAILYPVYGRHFDLYPDFNEKKFEADCEGKGRIRPGYLLVLAVYILRNKDVRALIKKR